MKRHNEEKKRFLTSWNKIISWATCWKPQHYWLPVGSQDGHRVKSSHPFCVVTSGTMCSFTKIAVSHAVGETEQRKIVSLHQLRQTNILNENLRLDLDVCMVFAHRTRSAPVGMNHVVATMTAALTQGKTATGGETPWPLWYSKRRAFWWTMLSVDSDALNAKQTKRLSLQWGSEWDTASYKIQKKPWKCSAKSSFQNATPAGITSISSITLSTKDTNASHLSSLLPFYVDSLSNHAQDGFRAQRANMTVHMKTRAQKHWQNNEAMSRHRWMLRQTQAKGCISHHATDATKPSPWLWLTALKLA